MNSLLMAFYRVPVSDFVSCLIACVLVSPPRLPALTVVFISLGALHAAAEDRFGSNRAAAQVEAFATCAGRFSALVARQVAHHDPAADQAVRLENDFDALVEAILPIAIEKGVDPRGARHWRMAGWMEMAHLMRLRYSKKDRSRADRAEAKIERRLTTCTRMILRG